MRVLLTRPLADSQRFATRLQRDGVDTVLAPLLHIEPVTQERPDFEGVQAVLLTSANGAHALAGLTDRRDFNILAVGPSTAAQANVEGFSDVAAAGGDVAKLADLARKRLRYLCYTDFEGRACKNNCAACGVLSQPRRGRCCWQSGVACPTCAAGT